LTSRKGHRGSRVSLNEDYALLGAELRRIREAAGKKTHEIPQGKGHSYTRGHVSNVEGGYTAPSEEFIRAYVGFGGRYDELMTLLDRAKRPQRSSEDEMDVVELQLLDPRSNPYTLRRGYAVDLQEDIAHLDGNGVPVKNLYTAVVRPLSSNAKYFIFRYGHEEDKRRGVASVLAGSGCSIALLEEDDFGTIYVVLEFEPSKADDLGRCRLSWSIEVDSVVPTRPFDAVHTKSRMGHIIKRVQFTAPALPERVSWFRDVDPFAAQLDPSSEQLLELNPQNFYVHEFFNVENEACGLAWRWSVS
jgi:hypothetical protein